MFYTGESIANGEFRPHGMVEYAANIDKKSIGEHFDMAAGVGVEVAGGAIAAGAVRGNSRPRVKTKVIDIIRCRRAGGSACSHGVQRVRININKIRPDADAPAYVKTAYAEAWEGTAGLYGDMRKKSLAGYLEADHIPPLSVYKDLPANNPFRHLRKDEMPAILIEKEKHRNFVTTGSLTENARFRGLQAADMANGNFYYSIAANIEAYKNMGLWSPAIKKGLIDLLDQHVAMGTIDRPLRDSIIAINDLA